MFKTISFSELAANTTAHTTAPVLDTFITFNAKFNNVQIFCTQNGSQNLFMPLEEVVALAAKMECDLIHSCDMDDTTTVRIRQAVDMSAVISDRHHLLNDTYLVAGDALAWNSSGNCVPESCFRDARVELPTNQESQTKVQQDAAFEIYRKNRESMTPEQKAEEAYERRAAFGI